MDKTHPVIIKMLNMLTTKSILELHDEDGYAMPCADGHIIDIYREDK